jgi:outer membrane protein insertion porin family
VLSQDFAGLGGSVKYVRTRLDADKYWRVLGNFILSVGFEGGIIVPFGKDRGAGIDRVRITDRFFLGEPEMRGFDIRGIGPRVLRIPFDTTTGALVTDKSLIQDDAIGGRIYYKGRLELEVPLGSGARELGLRPSFFVDVGSVFRVRTPNLTRLSDFPLDATGRPTAQVRPILDAGGNQQCIGTGAGNGGVITTLPVGGCGADSTLFANSIPPFDEQFLGDTWKPRLSVGFGVNWNSPFGPFRIDIAKALLKEPGDDTKLFTFNVGTQF